MWWAPGYKKFYAFVAQHQELHVIPKEDEDEDATLTTSASEQVEEEETTIIPTSTSPTRERPVLI